MQLVYKMRAFGYAWSSVVCVSVCHVHGKGKGFHIRYRALGPELIPVYRQSARR